MTHQEGTTPEINPAAPTPTALPVTEISYTLQEPVPTAVGTLTDVTFSKPNAGVLLRARAFITNNKALGPAMANDGLVLGAIGLRYCLIRSNLPTTPQDWTDLISQSDLMSLLERYNALAEGHGANLDAYRQAVKRRQQEAAAADAGTFS